VVPSGSLQRFCSLRFYKMMS